MKTGEEVVVIERSGDLKESSFGIEKGNEHHLLAILRDKLYSDKIMAVIREYTTNAVDAHMDAGKEKTPIKVTMPTRLNPKFIVRDYGLGLSEEDIRNLYVMYGSSTKRQTNKTVGQLGLGCKCGFAYNDSFTVVSYFMGHEKIYNAYIDESNVGAIALMSDTLSDELDGIEIRIAVNTQHVDQFHQKAAHLFSFFDVKPDVVGLLVSYPIKNFKYWLEGKLPNGVRWGLQEKNSQAIAVMGGIPYNIDATQFNFGSRGTYILNHGLHIWFRIGDLQMAANREALEYTPKTSKHIKVVIQKVIDCVAEAASKKVGEASSFREACIAHNKLKQESVFRHFAANTASKWNGEDIDGAILKTTVPRDTWDPAGNKIVGKEPDTKVQEVRLNRVYGRGNNQDTWTLSQNYMPEIEVEENTCIIEIDIPNKWKSKVEYFLSFQKAGNRLDNYGRTLKPRTFIVAYKDDAERATMETKWHLKEWKIEKISLLPDPPATFNPDPTPTMNKDEKKKHTKKILVLKDDFEHHPERKSDNWENVDIDITDEDNTKVFVEINHFFPILWKVRQNYSKIRFMLGLISTLGLSVNEIYGIKPAMIEKIKKNKTWVRLEELIVEKAIGKKDKLLRLLARDESLRQAPHSLSPYSAYCNSFPKGSPMRELLEYYVGLRDDKKAQEVDEDVLKLLQMAGHDLKREAAKELDRLLDAVRDRYPLLNSFRIFPDGYHHSLDKEQLDSVVQYVQIIEAEFQEDEEDDF